MQVFFIGCCSDPAEHGKLLVEISEGLFVCHLSKIVLDTESWGFGSLRGTKQSPDTSGFVSNRGLLRASQ